MRGRRSASPISSPSRADSRAQEAHGEPQPTASPGTLIPCGQIVGVWGVRGQFKVLSQTDPPEQLLTYHPWWLGPSGREAPVEPVSGRLLRRSLLVVSLSGVRDRDRALAYTGFEVSIERRLFAPPSPGQFYWTDLLGLTVEDLQGRERGVVHEIVRGPSGDVLDIRGPQASLLLPFLWQETVIEVDLDRGRIRVDWLEGS